MLWVFYSAHKQNIFERDIKCFELVADSYRDWPSLSPRISTIFFSYKLNTCVYIFDNQAYNILNRAKILDEEQEKESFVDFVERIKLKYR